MILSIVARGRNKMTVSTTTRKTQTPGNGSQVVFQFLFKILSESELNVAIANTLATGPLGLDELTGGGVDYTVTIAADGTGEITLVNNYAVAATPGPPSSLQTLTCYRITATNQATDFEAFDDFRSEDHEGSFDKLARITQELIEDVARCTKVHIASTLLPDDAVIQNYTLLTTTNERAPVLLDEVVASATPTADLSSSDMANHDIFELEFVNVRPATDDVGLWLRCSDDLGVSWNDDSYYNWKSVYMPDAGNTHDAEINYNDLDDRFYLVDVASTYKVPNAAYDTVSGTIRIHNLPSRPRIIGELSYSLLANAVMVKIIGGYISALDVDAFRVSFSAGAITSGSIRLWGLPTGS